MPVKVLALAGSTRTGSYNRMLAQFAGEAARQAGAEVTVINLHDFPMPLYDGDLEDREGLPANARKLRELFQSHDALIIASPEYNGSLSAVLKNTIDWLSRPQPGEPRLACFANKVGVILSTSTGALGGLRGLVHLRLILSQLQVLVLPDQRAVAHAADAFDRHGRLIDATSRTAIEQIVQKLVRVTTALKEASPAFVAK